MYKYKCIYQKCCMELPAIIIIVVPMHSYFYFFSGGGGKETNECSLDLSSNIILEVVVTRIGVHSVMKNLQSPCHKTSHQSAIRRQETHSQHCILQ